jgi:hypothetical protein
MATGSQERHGRGPFLAAAVLVACWIVFLAWLACRR